MQLLPQVASATVTLITLFTCGSNVVQCKCSRSLCVFFRSLKEALHRHAAQATPARLRFVSAEAAAVRMTFMSCSGPV